LPLGLDARLARVEEHVVGELDDHAPVAQPHLELARVDHLVKLHCELLEELSALVGCRLSLSELFEPRLGFGERVRQVSLFREQGIGVLPESLERSLELSIDGCRVVELGL
jgi:hypothetical protein